MYSAGVLTIRVTLNSVSVNCNWSPVGKNGGVYISRQQFASRVPVLDVNEPSQGSDSKLNELRLGLGLIILASWK
ncbi:hypothetical protein HanRHA438_Chr07g0298091 [Helianthus annuus]|nr:hypothetical protein HanRHA438_Chr07g0298091 [Helianthus annuus]